MELWKEGFILALNQWLGGALAYLFFSWWEPSLALEMTVAYVFVYTLYKAVWGDTEHVNAASMLTMGCVAAIAALSHLHWGAFLLWCLVVFVLWAFLLTVIAGAWNERNKNESILLTFVLLLPFGVGTVLGGFVLHWRYEKSRLPPPASFRETDPLWAERLP